MGDREMKDLPVNEVVAEVMRESGMGHLLRSQFADGGPFSMDRMEAMLGTVMDDLERDFLDDEDDGVDGDGSVTVQFDECFGTRDGDD